MNVRGGQAPALRVSEMNARGGQAPALRAAEISRHATLAGDRPPRYDEKTLPLHVGRGPEGGWPPCVWIPSDCIPL